MTEQAYGLREESAPDGGDIERKRIFFPHRVAQRTTQWERGDEPMTQFSFTEDYDAFGQSRRQTQIACPRGWRRLDDIPGEPYLTTQTRTDFAEQLKKFLKEALQHAGPKKTRLAKLAGVVR